MSKIIKSIAMFEPCGDYGIGGYTYELSEGLAANGVQVDMFTKPSYELRRAALPRRHRLLPALDSFAFRQRALLGNGSGVPTPAPLVATSHQEKASSIPKTRNRMYVKLRESLLPLELACHVRRARYDLVWIQMRLHRPYGIRFQSFCRRLGTKVVHTVHNVLPHELRAGDREDWGALYRNCDFLIVHSEAAKAAFQAAFPQIRAKLIVARHGLYTMFPRKAESRKALRNRLGIKDGQAALLFFGGVRPYKNLDAVLTAMRSPRLRDAVLIVAGRESGYDDLAPDDPLGRTRRIAEELKVLDRLRLLGGTFDIQETSEIFEASDAVLLPYVESYGSGLLLLAMTFGKFIVATAAGGMDEYLARYPGHILLNDSRPASVVAGLGRCLDQLAASSAPNHAPQMPELEWPNIARGILREISAGLRG